MAAASKELLALVGRVRRIGWDVEQAPAGGATKWLYMVTAPDGFHIQLHSTPSDTNWEKSVLRKLNDHGFAEAEKAWLENDETQRLAKIEADRAKNERALAEAQKRAASVSKAAGPYGPQVASIDWIFTRHELPETKRCLITPELARKILDELNTSNRPLRESKVTYWQTIMKSGRWLYTHQGLAFSTTGALQDGQHRLEAAHREGFTLDINISVGMPDENFAVVDTGTIRSGADTLAVEGKDNVNILAAATKLVMVYDVYGVESRFGISRRQPNEAILAAATKYGKRLDEAVLLAKEINHYKSGPHMSPNALAAGIYLISRRLAKSNELVAEFLRGYKEGTDLPTGDSRIALRTFMFNMKDSRHRKVPVVDQLGVFIKAWNAWVTNRGVTTISFRKDELMPKVILPPRDLTPNGIQFSDDEYNE